MSWVEIFAVFSICHLAGDFLVQTDWQARNKIGGLGRGPEERRALAAHIFTYLLCFVPALIWLWDSLGAGVIGIAALIAVPHAIQDDGRLLSGYLTRVKHAPAEPGDLLYVTVDQSFHLLALFVAALIAAA
jgi:Protein of unknown function (DUF3307)